MDVKAAVKYLNYKKLKLRALVSIFGLRLEKILEKPIFMEKPYLVSVAFTSINIIISMIIYLVLYIFFPEIFTDSLIVFYMFFISTFIFLMAFIQFKNDFFTHFKNDHFFNLLGFKQNEYIIKTIHFNTNELLLRYFLPLLLPIFFHLLIFNKLYFIITLFPLILVFLKHILPFFIITYLHLNALAKEYFLIKIFLFICFSVYMGFVFTCLGIATALLIDDFIKIKLSNTFIMYASIFLLIINLLLYLLKNIPKTIINKNYKRYIYIEGNIQKNKKDNNYPYLQKFISLGMYALDVKEKAIYQKDLKNILRNKTARISMIIVGIIMTTILSLIALFSPIRTLKGFKVSDLLPLYFFLNMFIIYALGYFMLIHKHISSFSAEGYNHLIYQKIKINYYKVYKAKLFFNRFFVLFPFIPFFIFLSFGIRSLDSLLLYIISLLYYWGVVNLVIKLEMIEDFFNPRFNGQIKNEKLIKQNYLNNYLSFIVFALLIIPSIFTEFSQINSLYMILILIGIIYILNFVIYRKSLALKKVKVINYGGIEFVRSK